MAMDFKENVRNREIIYNFPIRRFRILKNWRIFWWEEMEKTLYYPEITIERGAEIEQKYLNQETIEKSKLGDDREFLEAMIDELYDLYREDKTTRKWLKRRDLKRLEPVELGILMMDTVNCFSRVKKKGDGGGSPLPNSALLGLAGKYGLDIERLGKLTFKQLQAAIENAFDAAYLELALGSQSKEEREHYLYALKSKAYDEGSHEANTETAEDIMARAERLGI